MIQHEDACFGCGAVCRMSCSLYDKQNILLFCDKCRREVDTLYEIDIKFTSRQLCDRCLLDIFESSEGKCEECGDEDTVYDIDGRLLCENCALDKFTVLTEEDM